MVFIRDRLKVLQNPIIPNDVEKRLCRTEKFKWLFCGSCHPPSLSDEYFFKNLDKALDTYSKYHKALLAR